MERKDIYRERKSIEEFGVDEKNTVNNVMFDVLFQIEGVSGNEETMLSFFNDAYYICTLILLEKRPYFNLEKYQIVLGGNNPLLSFSYGRVITIMSMVAVYLKSLDMITNDIDKVIKAIKTRYSGCDGNIYETITAIIDGRDLVTKAFVFYPLHFPANYDYSDFWKTYQNFPKEMSDIIKSHIETWMDTHTASEEEVRQIVRGYGKRKEQGKSLFQQYKDGVMGGKTEDSNKRAVEMEKEMQAYKEQVISLQSELDLIRGANADVVTKFNKRIEELQKELQSYKEMHMGEKQYPQISLTNNSNFARVIQAMVSARYFKRANGDETNATEVGSMLLKLFGVSNTWKSVLQKAFSRENPLKTYDDLRDAGQRYWEERTGITKDIRKKGKK